jgi:GNAT superfamily N-acetyltransferase
LSNQVKGADTRPFRIRRSCSKIHPLPTPPQIRTAAPPDAPAIARLVNHAFRAERFFIAADRTDPDKVAALLQKGKFLLLFEDGALTGSVYTELRGERGYFGLLAVDPQRQRSGIGAHLIAAAEQYCRAAGCRFMDLTFVNVRQELPAYYQRFGYVENGALPFPADQVVKIPVHLVQMSKPL